MMAGFPSRAVAIPEKPILCGMAWQVDAPGTGDLINAP